MDYLRTLGSAAVSSLVQKSGLNLPFSLGPKVTSLQGIWNLYDGTKKDDGSSVSIFEFDCADPSKRNLLPLAKNALRKLRTTRHPDVLKFMDAVETDTTIHIMTERVRPLPPALQAWSSRNPQEKEDWILWGLHRISVALTFVNDSCASTHGNLRTYSIFISPSGEWKLGGFELLSNPKDEAAVLYSMAGLVPEASSWAPPEVKKDGWSVLKQYGVAAADAYSLGLLLHSVFNLHHPLPATTQPPHLPPQPSSRGAIPSSVFPAFKQLLNPNAKARMTPKNFLEAGMVDNGFFSTNRLVKICLGLDNFSLVGEAERNAFLRILKDSASSFPTEFATFRVLPSLTSALEYGGASAGAILPIILRLGDNISADEYARVIIAPLVKLFPNPDRGTRMALLDNLHEFADKLDKKIVSDKIWPHLQTGFSDTVAVIREVTVKSISLLYTKFNERILNNELLRFLAKMQMDPEPSIRTNTCILIGRLGPSLGYNTKRKVLVPAFSRALKDSFVHTRVAGLMALMATIECFDIDDLATKVIPNMSFAMLDKEKLVRDQAFKALDLFISRLKAHAATMPDTVLQEGVEGPTSTAPIALPEQTTIVSSAAGAAGALAGWAFSSLGKKLALVDMQSTISGAPAVGSDIDRLTSAPPTENDSKLQLSLSSATVSAVAANSVASSSNPLSGTNGQSKAKGMQLGSNRTSSSIATAVLAAELEEFVANDNGDANPWGNDDLIDINADQDDWSAFETAPTEPTSLSANYGNIPTISGKSTPNSLMDNHRRLTDDPWVDTGSSSRSFTSGSVRKKGKSPSPCPSMTLNPTSIPTITHTTPSLSQHSPQIIAPKSTPLPSLSGMSREARAAEMVRRKEERRQRIAQLKEQKRTAAHPKG